MRRIPGGLLAAAAMAWGAASARADERHFTYSYETQTLTKGSVEVEQWATARFNRDGGRYHVFELREEFEYGVTDRLTTSLYLNWKEFGVQETAARPGEHGAVFDSFSNEWKFKLWDPDVDPVGLLLYAELGLGEDVEEIELKAVAQKNVGDWRVAYNLVLEMEREKSFDSAAGADVIEKSSALIHTVGVSYQVDPNFAVGLEGYHAQDFDEIYKHQVGQSLFVGPVVHVAWSKAWATFTVLRQVDVRPGHGLDLDNHERYEARIIFAINF